MRPPRIGFRGEVVLNRREVRPLRRLEHANLLLAFFESDLLDCGLQQLVHAAVRGFVRQQIAFTRPLYIWVLVFSGSDLKGSSL